jgi:hypothetical protein
MSAPLSDHVALPYEKLSRWMFAASHAAWALECRIEDSKARGFDTSYDQLHLEAMQDLHMFLKMSWDGWMDSLDAALNDMEIRLDALEVKTNV